MTFFDNIRIYFQPKSCGEIIGAIEIESNGGICEVCQSKGIELEKPKKSLENKVEVEKDGWIGMVVNSLYSALVTIILVGVLASVFKINIVAIILLAIIIFIAIKLWMMIKSAFLLSVGIGFFAMGVFLISEILNDNTASAIHEIEAILFTVAGVIAISSSAIISEIGRVRKALENKVTN